MHKFYKAINDLRDKKYEEAANSFYEFIFEDEFKTNVGKAIKELESNGKLQLSIEELSELHGKAKKYFENKTDKLLFDLGVISIFTNQKEYNLKYTKNEYLDKAFELSKNTDILLKLSIVYVKYGNEEMACKCINKCYQLLLK